MLEHDDRYITIIDSSIIKRADYSRLLAVILKNKVDELKNILEGSDYLINETPRRYEGKTLLFQACKNNLVGCAQVLLAHGARSDIICNQQFLAIDAACETCNPELIKLMYHNPTEIEFSCWILSFIKACCGQDVDAVSLAVEDLVAITLVPCENYDLSSIQAFITDVYKTRSAEGVIKFFLDESMRDSAANAVEEHCMTVSLEVSWLRRCVAVFKTKRPYLWTDIIKSFIKSDCINDLKLLLSVVPVSLIGRHISLALGSASASGSAPIVNLLLAYGADPNFQDSSGETSLHRAHHSTAQILLDHGANIHALDKKGATPLHQACASGESALVDVLLSSGANIAARTNDRSTALHMVCAVDYRGHRCSRLEIVRHLLDRDATVINAVDGRGYTALMSIGLDIDRELSTLLLERGANPNVYYDDGRTLLLRALHYYSRSKARDHARLLVKYGADVNLGHDDNHETPLMLACLLRKLDLKLVKILLDAGADIDAPADSTGKSVYSLIATSPEHGELRKLCELYISIKPVLK